MRTIVTDGIVVRHYWSSLSSKATDRYKAHLWTCRYAKAEGTQPIADLIEVKGAIKVRARIAIGIIEPCKVCRPILLVDEGCEPPILCRYCGRQSDPETAYYPPDPRSDFRLCDDCAREAAEELSES